MPGMGTTVTGEARTVNYPVYEKYITEGSSLEAMDPVPDRPTGHSPGNEEPPSEPVSPNEGVANAHELPRRRSRPRWVPIVAAVVAAGAILAGLFFAGLPPFGGQSSNPASGDVATGDTSAQAVAAAAAEAPNYGPGPWQPMLVAGAAPSAPVLESTAVASDTFSFAGDGSCVGHSEMANTTVASFPGFDGNISAGQAPSWVVVEMNATGTMLFVLVVSGSVQPVELFTGPACALFELVGTLPANAVNSSVAAAAAGQGGLRGFAQAHPGGWTTYAAADVGGAGEWQVEYSTCPAVGNASASTVYYTFLANVSLTTGALIGSPENGPARCSGMDLSGPLAMAASHAAAPYEVNGWGPSITQYMGVGSAVRESNGSQYSYTVTVTSAASRLSWQDLVFSIRNSTDQVPNGPYSVVMQQSGGCIIAEGALDDPVYLAPLFGGGCSGNMGGAVAVLTGDTVTIDSTVALAGMGDLFEIHSASLDYSGNITLPIA